MLFNGSLEKEIRARGAVYVMAGGGAENSSSSGAPHDPVAKMKWLS